jgi:hypothetical protein
MSAYLRSINWLNIFSSDVESLWQLFKNIINTCIQLYVPHCAPMRGVKKKQYPHYIRRALNHKHILWRARHNHESFVRYKLQATKCKKMIKRFNRSKERRLLNKNSLSAFYRHINRKLYSSRAIAPLRNINGSITSVDAHKTEILNAYFASVFSNSSNGTQQQPVTPPALSLNSSINVDFSPSVIFAAILKAKKPTQLVQIWFHLFSGPS